ncbi:hypothetical protein [Scleromatobacter humisilvae]|uniref:DUF4124 domain-containing protein n=1 Tax=Scleromatobacter humisilvae TaxID=2897159 RepID=A0A9X1YHP1_9BURK|nr:hypothetical protein [Scleromatobacter humisilvae]MCK9684592.1 hypothetical protein [Scleromatobacter humisilvae]
MVRSTGWAGFIALAGLALGGSAHAQAVHKCIVNGAAVYQAAACPAANDQKSLVIPAPPSQQELLDATANGRLQSVQPGATAPTQATPRRYDRNRTLLIELTPSQQDAPAAPSNNCDQLNQSYQDAKYRRDELSAPGSGATRSAALQRAIDDMKRVQDQAANTQCHLR